MCTSALEVPFVHVICCYHAVFKHALNLLFLHILKNLPFVFTVPNILKKLLICNIFKYLLKSARLLIVFNISGLGCNQRWFSSCRYSHISMIIKQCCQNKTEHVWYQPNDCLLEDPHVTFKHITLASHVLGHSHRKCRHVHCAIESGRCLSK